MLERLKDAGLGSLPGGGGEILVDRVRKATDARARCSTDEWLEVHRVWHQLGGRSTCTMMFGHIETLAERIEHLDAAPRTCRTRPAGSPRSSAGRCSPGHKMADVPPAGSFEYLRTQAIARLYLDNIPNIQSSWVTQGAKIGQVALFFGANDMGSLMIEENVVASAGTVHYLTLGADQAVDPRGGLRAAAAERLLRVHRRRARTARELSRPQAADLGTARVPYSRAGTCWQRVSR